MKTAEITVDNFTLKIFRVEPSSDAPVVLLGVFKDGKYIDDIALLEEEAEVLGNTLLHYAKGEEE